MFRFLHTGDWQLGMTRHFFGPDAQERYDQARFAALRTMMRAARERGCAAVVVCGDAFESNRVAPRTVRRALEALREPVVPVHIVPGNHDPLDEGSVYRSAAFREAAPAHVHVVEDAAPVPLADGVELVGAPWTSKRPVANPLWAALAGPPPPGVRRVAAGHGLLDRFGPDASAPGRLAAAELERAVAEGRAHFIALGDRHSRHVVDAGGRIAYAGTPVATDFREVDSGSALIVTLGGGSGDGDVALETLPVGDWRFVERDRVDLAGGDDVDALLAWLDGLPAKERTAVRVRLVGTLPFAAAEAMRARLDAARDLLAALRVDESALLALPADVDYAALGFVGFADAAVRRLRAAAEAPGRPDEAARDALGLLLRLARAAE